MKKLVSFLIILISILNLLCAVDDWKGKIHTLRAVFDLNESSNQYMKIGFSKNRVSLGSNNIEEPENNKVILAWKDWPKNDEPNSIIKLLSAEVYIYWHVAIPKSGKLELKVEHKNTNVGQIDIKIAEADVNNDITVSSAKSEYLGDIKSFDSGGVYFDCVHLDITTETTNEEYKHEGTQACTLTLKYVEEG